MRRTNLLLSGIFAVAAGVTWFYAVGMRGYVRFGVSLPHENFVPLAVTLTAVACFLWLLAWVERRRMDDQTRCRKCGYILRGITEPRCPECGEKI